MLQPALRLFTARQQNVAETRNSEQTKERHLAIRGRRSQFRLARAPRAKEGWVCSAKEEKGASEPPSRSRRCSSWDWPLRPGPRIGAGGARHESGLEGSCRAF